MASNAEMHLMYKTANAPVSWFPFPHGFIEDVFPAETHADIQRNIPESSAMTSLADTGRVTPGAYKERFILPLGGDDMSRLPAATQQFWTDFSSWLLSGRYKKLLLDKFKPLVAQSIPDQTKVDFRDEAMLVQDVTKYSLGPHTDSQTKVVTLLFYLPRDTSQTHLGTSIYLPRQPGFLCKGGPHYRHENFVRLVTMPFKPNSLFFFFKTDGSFHGVEPVTDPDARRWLLLYDIYARPKTA
jgi:hypothetical protein